MNLPSFSFLLNIRGAFIASLSSTGRGHLRDSRVRIRKQGREGVERWGRGLDQYTPRTQGKEQTRVEEMWAHVVKTVIALSPLSRIPQERSL